ncbi:MAG: hypothetical protein U0821_02385 [Chloroflexota bacterium]
MLATLVAIAALSADLLYQRDSVLDPTGRLVVPRGGALSVVDLGAGTVRQITAGVSGDNVTAAAWSPDRSKIYFAVFHRRQGDPVGSSEIYAAEIVGGATMAVVERQRPGDVFDGPVALQDAESLLVTFQGTVNRASVSRVERVDLGDRRRVSLFEDAAQPTVSPDGSVVAVVTDGPQGPGLGVGPISGGDVQEIVSAGTFKLVAGPRFSPTDDRIAFTAVGGPAGVRSAGAAWPLSVFETPIAFAHGEPWRVWTVRPNGSDLASVGTFQEDEPLLSWSPDGDWLAVMGTGGLWLVRPDGKREPMRIGEGGYGALDWAR